MKIEDVQSLIEDHLKQLVIKHFDPKMADTIFKDESGVCNLLKVFDILTHISILQTPDWLTDLIMHKTWRSLVYKLAEDYPDCLMLTFTIKVWFDAVTHVPDPNKMLPFVVHR